MPISWTILYNGQEKSFDDWGITKPVRELVNLDVDTFRFVINGVLFEQDFTFPQDSILSVKRDGVQIFYGAVKMPQRMGRNDSVYHSYTLVNPYWWLKHIVFQQPCYYSKTAFSADALVQFASEGIVPDPTTGLLAINISHLILNLGFQQVNGFNLQVKVGTATQIQTALDWAISHGAPMAVDSLFVNGVNTKLPAINVPTSEVRNNMCNEVVERQLSWVPDAGSFFDYTTTPFPTFHVNRRATAPAVTINALDGSVIGEGIELKPRYDLQVPSVVLQYEQTNTVNSTSFVNLVIKKFPATASGSEVNALVQNINLEGSVVNFATASLTVGTIEINNLNWWREDSSFVTRLSWLNNPNVRNLTLVSGSASRQLNQAQFPNEILLGQYCPWMGGNVSKDVATAQVSYDVYDEDGLLVQGGVIEDVNWPIKTATNLSSGDFQSAPDFITAEEIPIDLEKEIWNSTAPLHYDGSITFASVSGECPCIWKPGMLLNIADGRPEWATMNAIVQTVTDDLTTGQTTITIGPPKHLGVAQIIELLRQTRFRWKQTNNSTMGNGVSSVGSNVTLGTRFPGGSPTSGKGTIDRQVIGTNITIDKADLILVQPVPNPNPSIPAPPAVIQTGTTALVPTDPRGGKANFREMKVCVPMPDGTHEIWRCQVLCTDLYKVEGDN